MISVNSLKDEIFSTLRDYVKKEFKLVEGVRIMQYVEENSYPLIVFENNTNNISSRTRDRIYETRNLSFTIDIYAINVGSINSLQICEELSDLVINVMQGIYDMNGGITAKLSNINTAKATKFVLHFNCEWWTNKNKIF